MVQGVPGPLASPVVVYNSGFSEDLKAMGDGALALADGLDEVAYADLSCWSSGDMETMRTRTPALDTLEDGVTHQPPSGFNVTQRDSILIRIGSA